MLCKSGIRPSFKIESGQKKDKTRDFSDVNWGGVARAYVESAGNISSGRWDCILADAQVYNKQTMAVITQVTEELGDTAESYVPCTATVFDWYVSCS